jgi:hypothetical protein
MEESKNKIIEVYESCSMSFWKKKGDACSSRDIIELAKLINDGWQIKII